MAMVSLRGVCAGYGGELLLEDADLNIERGQRLCLLGRNGAGKSTLLKLISGNLEVISGSIEFQKGIRIAGLAQEVPAAAANNVFDVVASGLGEQGQMLKEYHKLSSRLAETHTPELTEQLNILSGKIDAAGAWQSDKKIETVLSLFSLDAQAPFATLSAGLKRRVMLAAAIADSPDLLLLDEPTNHLDIATIRRLEDYLLGSSAALLFVTHDRSFLRKLSTNIIEIDRSRLMQYDCDYDQYLKRKQQMLDAEEATFKQFDKKLVAEEIWLRKGIQGRRTRNEGRVRALKQMRLQKQQRKLQPAKAKMLIQNAQNSGELVAELKNIGFAYEEIAPIIDGFTATVIRGDRIGILGPNGIGKTTLLNLIIGKIKPQTGSVRLGTNLQVAYFDQLHNRLNENKSVADNVADGYKTIEIDGNPRNIIGYLKDFLFLPERSNSLVSSLSGGERSRLLLAKLFTKPANVLILDEPTNNLDVETLELLEQLISDFKGTILVVSHDREFLNNTATSLFVFEGEGKIKEYVGGYDDYLRQSKTENEAKQPPKPARQRQDKHNSKPKLSFKQKQLLQELPSKIETAEEQLARLHGKLASPDFYKSADEKEIAASAAKIEQLQSGDPLVPVAFLDEMKHPADNVRKNDAEKAHGHSVPAQIHAVYA